MLEVVEVLLMVFQVQTVLEEQVEVEQVHQQALILLLAQLILVVVEEEVTVH